MFLPYNSYIISIYIYKYLYSHIAHFPFASAYCVSPTAYCQSPIGCCAALVAHTQYLVPNIW